MSDRVCVRGCVQPGIHYAACPAYGPNPTDCAGCAPAECRDGSYLCDRCFGRVRGLLDDLDDLRGRLQALSDPLRTKPLDQVRARVTEPAPPIGYDLIDAATALTAVWSGWAYWNYDLTGMSNNLEACTWLVSVVLERHPATDGIRHAWSVQDAVDRWGVERRDRNPEPWIVDETSEEEATGIPEWFDPLIVSSDAAKLAKVTESQLRKWVTAGVLTPRAKLRDGRGVQTSWYYTSEVEAATELMGERRYSGGRHVARLDK